MNPATFNDCESPDRRQFLSQVGKGVGLASLTTASIGSMCWRM